MPTAPRTALAVAALTVAAAAIAPAAASASGLTVAGPGACGDQPLSKPFLRFGDVADYTPLPGGSFEPGDAAWSLSGGSATSAGNEPWQVAGDDDSASLAIPAGGSATSAPLCVSVEHPTVRFFSRADRASLSGLSVDVIIERADGGRATLPLGTIGATSSSWSPNLPWPIAANLVSVTGQTSVRFRFTAGAGTGWKVDDVFVDPKRR